ncbi:MAG: DUF885 domain-containing protein [Saprospiraceae bacterium]|nr:DUF885 domain-containing protein [Saprospiraceae bacterium]
MKYFLFLVAATSVLFQCTSVDRNSKHSKVDEIIESYQAISDTLQKQYKDTWGEQKKAEFENRLSLYEPILNQLENLDTTKLSLNDLINKELLELELSNEITDLKFQSYLMPLNSEGGFLLNIIYSSQYLDVRKPENRKKYIEKLHLLPAYLQAQKELMQEGIRQNKTSPKTVTKLCINMLEDFISQDADNNFLVHCTEGLNDADSLKNEVISLVQAKIKPAYKEFLAFVYDEYLPASQDSPGISALEGGNVYYEDKVRYFTTLELTPEMVFTTGESEVARIKSEMLNIINEIGFKGDYAAFLHFLRTDPQFYAKNPRELLYRASWLSKKIEGKLPKYFNKLPRMPFSVEPVPEAIAPNYTTGRYSEGNYETGKPGEYWVNTFKLESRPFYVLPALTLHEAVPGHHLQIMLSKEMENIPKFRENLYISAFGEGWGLYSEYLGKEAGMYETPYEDFGRLTYEMWRACRLVVDVGLHYKGWTRQQAVDFMSTNTALSLHEVNTEIDRYIGWPAQAVSYKIGELKIRELRKRAEEILGDKFDIKAFHDLVLSNGSIKLSTLEQIVDNYISDNKVNNIK